MRATIRLVTAFLAAVAVALASRSGSDVRRHERVDAARASVAADSITGSRQHVRAATSLRVTSPRPALSKRHDRAANKEKVFQANALNKLDNLANTADSTPTDAPADAAPKPRSWPGKTYPPRTASAMPKLHTAKAANARNYHARHKAKATSASTATERAAAMAQRARNAVRGNALKQRVDAFRSVAAARRWLDADTELPVFRALRDCASDYGRALKLVSATVEEARAAKKVMRGRRSGANAVADAGGAAEAGAEADVMAAAEAAAGPAQWAEWQAQLLRGRRCHRWLYDTGLENMRRAGERGDPDGPPTEAWAWLMINWPRIREKWDALGESDASDEEVLGSRTISSGGWGSGALAHRIGRKEVAGASPRHRRLSRWLRPDRESVMQDWPREVGRAAGMYVRQARDALWDIADRVSRGVGAVKGYVTSPGNVVSVLQRGLAAQTVRSPRPIQRPVGLGRPWS